MSPGDRELRAAIDELAKAVQVIAGCSSELRRTLGESAELAIELEGAALRAVRALKRLQPRTDKKE